MENFIIFCAFLFIVAFWTVVVITWPWGLILPMICLLIVGILYVVSPHSHSVL
ncbi:MAG: hypothetical protein ISS36_02355 [Candidatus Aenigmarchaeota archaeon]|nr:hypothetical protein [Candidatus Aenigmarchaeota archaeon]